MSGATGPHCVPMYFLLAWYSEFGHGEGDQDGSWWGASALSVEAKIPSSRKCGETWGMPFYRWICGLRSPGISRC